MIIASQLQQLSPPLLPQASQMWATELSKGMTQWEINTIMRVQQFLATLMHESQGLQRVEENLNYSADGLLKVFPKLFKTREQADLFARKPQSIANKVYANRMGNGAPESGDGWNYRGRGPIQATGKDMYRAVGKAINPADTELFVKNPELLLKPELGSAAACWIWKSKGCNELADKGNFQGVTKKINGGLNGMPDREAWLVKCKKIVV
jgi:putative chitinase